MSIRWIPDQDDAESVDDLFAQGVDVRMERMDRGYYWLCIYDGAEEHHFDLSVPARSRTKIRAFARQPEIDPDRKLTHTSVDNHNLWLLVLHEMRYAMGRMTSAPSTSANHVRQFRGAFDSQQRDHLFVELREACGGKRSLGHECDERVWVELLAWMEANR